MGRTYTPSQEYETMALQALEEKDDTRALVYATLFLGRGQEERAIRTDAMMDTAVEALQPLIVALIGTNNVEVGHG